MTAKLLVTIVSATDLKKARKNVYAVAYISGDKITKKRTGADRSKTFNPNWNHSLKFKIPESQLRRNDLVLVIELYRKRFIMKDVYMGRVDVAINTSFMRADNHSSSPTPRSETRPLCTKSRTSKGTLNFSYSLLRTQKRRRLKRALKKTVTVVWAVTFAVATNVLASFLMLGCSTDN